MCGAAPPPAARRPQVSYVDQLSPDLAHLKSPAGLAQWRPLALLYCAPGQQDVRLLLQAPVTATAVGGGGAHQQCACTSSLPNHTHSGLRANATRLVKWSKDNALNSDCIDAWCMSRVMYQPPIHTCACTFILFRCVVEDNARALRRCVWRWLRRTPRSRS